MFSVVIPLYNKEDTIAGTIDSVLNQTYTNFEIIVVNDGSTDQSKNIVQGFSDSRIKLFTKPNGGVSAARNFGIAMGQYNYIAFLDADDFWEPQYLYEMERLIRCHPECGMYSSAYTALTKNKSIIACTELPEGTLNDFFQVRLQHHIFRTSATIVSKEAVDEVGGFPVGMIAGEDDYTWSKIAIRYKAAFTPKVLVTYNGIKSSYNSRKGKVDSCQESWLDLLQEGDFYRNEFIAHKAIMAGIRYAFGKPQPKSREIEQRTRYTALFKKSWNYLYFLNRVPYPGAILIKEGRILYKKVKFWLLKQRRNLIQRFKSEVLIAGKVGS